jgi:hypothetical protein
LIPDASWKKNWKETNQQDSFISSGKLPNGFLMTLTPCVCLSRVRGACASTTSILRVCPCHF